MRVTQANELYRRTSDLGATKTEKKKTVAPQAKTTTTSFGFRLGKFGLDYQSERTVLDPSLSRDVQEQKKQARAFQTEAEVEQLRAQVGTEGANYRETATQQRSDTTPSKQRVQTAMTAYAKAREAILPPPGAMLAGVV